MEAPRKQSFIVKKAAWILLTLQTQGLGPTEAYGQRFSPPTGTDSSQILSSVEQRESAASLCSASKLTFGPTNQEFLSQQFEFWDVEIEGVVALIGSVFTLHRLSAHNDLENSRALDINLRTIAFQDATHMVGSDSLEGIRFFSRSGIDGNWVLQGRARDPLRRRDSGDYSSVKIAEVFGVDIRSENSVTNALYGPTRLRTTEADSLRATLSQRLKFSETYDGHVTTIVLGHENFSIGSVFGGQLVVTNGSLSSEVDSAIDRFGYGSLSLAKDGVGNLLLWDQGLVAIQNELGVFQPIKGLPLYARPLMLGPKAEFDLVHGPNRISSINETGNKRLRSFNREVKNWIRNGWFLKSAALSANQDKLILLFKAGTSTDSGFAVVESNTSRATRYNCGPSASNPIFGTHQSEVANSVNLLTLREVSKVPRPLQEIAYKEIGPDDHRMAVWTLTPSTKLKGRVIYFRGGPNLNLLQDGLEKIDRKLLDAGFEIIRYEYSGARQVSPDIYSRLRSDIRSSLEEDAGLVRQDLSSRKPVENTVVIAASFGALMAGAVSKNPQIRVDRYVLAVPFGEWMPPSDYAPTADPIWGKRQSEMQNSTFGVPSLTNEVSFNNFTQAYRQSICAQADVFLIFGKFDRSIKQDGWRKDCQASSNRLIEVNTAHRLDNEMADAILSASLLRP